MLDGPTLLRNKIVRLVCKGLHVLHHFTLPYTPRSNGSNELLDKDLLHVFRFISPELYVRTVAWSDSLLFVQSALNNNTSLQRPGTPLIKAVTGFDATFSISTFYRSFLLQPLSFPGVDCERALMCRQLCKILASLRLVMQYVLKKVTSGSAVKLLKVMYSSSLRAILVLHAC